MIGKYSKADWSKDAPKGATHVGVSTHRVLFYQNSGSFWLYWSNTSNLWCPSDACHRSDYTLYSKEEDLKMKEVKSIADLEVGMFVKFKNESISKAVILIRRVSEINFIFIGNCSTNDTMAAYYKGLSYEPNYDYDIVAWSYSLNGEYTPVIHEPVLTPEQLKINELEQTIANASKQLEELKGLRNDNSNN